MNSLVGNSATSLENIAAELGDPVLEKLSDAGITSVEALADMTPEELEAIPGIDSETVEKISVAVNNYFSTLESAGQEVAVEEETAAGEEVSADAAEAEYTSDPLLAPDAEAALAEVQVPVEALGESDGNVADTGEVKNQEQHPGEHDENPGNK